MDLYNGYLQGLNTVSDRITVMGIRTCIKYYALCMISILLHDIYQYAFAVALKTPYGTTILFRMVDNLLLKILKGLFTINVRLPFPQKIKIWSVNHKKDRFFRHRVPPPCKHFGDLQE